MRPRSQQNADLPPRMTSSTRTNKNGKTVTTYYYLGKNDAGKQKRITLGTDLNEAKRQWAELERIPAPVETGLMRFIFDRYAREIIPTKAPGTQILNIRELRWLRMVFDDAPISAITPQHIAQYRDNRTAKTRANRELALFSHVFNLAREWGYTDRENPVRGVRKNKEKPRRYYAEHEVVQLVLQHGDQALKDAAELCYLTGQRVADTLKMRWADIQNGMLEVEQNKTETRLRIRLTDETGQRNSLGQLLDTIRSRAVLSVTILCVPDGRPISKTMLRKRFETARTKAAAEAETQGNEKLAATIRAFQFRDLRAKAATDKDNLTEASELLGHSDKQITQTVYRRRGQVVNPVKKCF